MMNKWRDETMGNQQESLVHQDLVRIPASDGYYTDGKGTVFSRRQRHLKPIKSMIHFGRGKKPYRRVKAGGKLWLEHRFIASALIGRQLKQSEQVNHLNGDTQDNALTNLEVVSHRDNVRHAVQNGLYCSGKEWYTARGMLKG